ncbi:MAG TPA: cupredoxin domain-containing protein [Candidatus Limnocylindrales bacterium]|nr:cupredoxin domain-containing protein [Candidatus Limnocylindrales bacterium]
MRRSLIALTIALSAALAACTSSAPGWTFAPPTPPPAVTPAPSGEATGAPASEAPASEAPSDGGSGGGEVVKEAALMIAYVNKELSAPADAPFKLEFDNQDAGIPHNIEIKDASGASVFKGETFNGAAIKTYDVPALAAGEYAFVCTVHPNMVGTLKVGG